MPCPLSKAYVRKGCCDCDGNRVPWKHIKCSEPDWVDAEGNIHCTPSCPNNKRPIFGDNFICGTDKSKVGQFVANKIMKSIMAMRTNACEAEDELGIDDEDAEALLDWCQALERNLMK